MKEDKIVRIQSIDFCLLCRESHGDRDLFAQRFYLRLASFCVGRMTFSLPKPSFCIGKDGSHQELESFETAIFTLFY